MKLNVKKTLLTLLATSTLALTRSGIAGKGIIFDKGDYVETKSLVNIRLDNSLDSKIIGNIDKNEKVFRILSMENNWDLIKYNDKIGYVSRDYLTEISEITDSVIHYEIADLVKTDSKVNFRLEPNLEGKRITSIPKGEQLKVVATTDNNWYLVLYNNIIGYISGDYVDSLLAKVDEIYPDLALDGIEVEKIVYTTARLNIRSGNSLSYEKIGVFSKYESLLVLKEYDNWYLVTNNDGIIGFVDKSYTKELNGVYLIIDLSNQMIWLYNNNELLFSSNIVTGKNDTPTHVGLFDIDAKERNRYLVGEDYKAYVEYWMPFDGGIGLHDASWRSNFGSDIYINNGSHGCVNLPPKVAEKIYNNVEVGTKVLVHK